MCERIDAARKALFSARPGTFNWQAFDAIKCAEFLLWNPGRESDCLKYIVDAEGMLGIA
jgi:hypothetical protein